MRLAEMKAAHSVLPAPDNDGTASGAGGGGGYALADFVRAQILRRWWPNLDTDSARGTPVAMLSLPKVRQQRFLPKV